MSAATFRCVVTSHTTIELGLHFIPNVDGTAVEASMPAVKKTLYVFKKACTPEAQKAGDIARTRHKPKCPHVAQNPHLPNPPPLSPADRKQLAKRQQDGDKTRTSYMPSCIHHDPNQVPAKLSRTLQKHMLTASKQRAHDRERADLLMRVKGI